MNQDHGRAGIHGQINTGVSVWDFGAARSPIRYMDVPLLSIASAIENHGNQTCLLVSASKNPKDRILRGTFIFFESLYPIKKSYPDCGI